MDDLLSIAVSNAAAATVLALVAVAVGAVHRRPALLHGLWLLVLLKLVTPPLFFLPISWPTTAAPTPATADVQEEPMVSILPVAEQQEGILNATPADDREEPAGVGIQVAVDDLGALTQPSLPLGALTQPRSPLWPQILSIFWGAGALAWFLLALLRLHHFRRLLRFARPASAALLERTRRLAESLGLSYCPRVRLLPGRIAPMLWAIGGSPRLLVPADLLAGLSDEQFDTLLVHELAHLRRRDHWVRILEFAVMGLYWWHPVLWYARRELREAEEQCCDAWVVSTLPGAGRTYASALLDTLDFLSATQTAVPPLASGLSQIVDLKRRLTMIMRGNTPRSLTWPGCLAVVVLGLAFLPILPSLHGQAPSKEEASKSVDEAAKALEQAKTALEAARAKMEYEKAHLEMQKALVARAQDQLKKTAQGQQKVLTERLQRQAAVLTLTVRDQKKEDKSGVRIVIECDDVEGINVSDLGKKLKDLFPKKNAHISIALDSGVRVTQPSPKAGITVQTEGKRIVEVRPKPVTVAVPSIKIEKVSGNQDKRINDLEKKLEKVLQELQELRKQMRPPRGRSVSPPTPAAGPAQYDVPAGIPATPEPSTNPRPVAPVSAPRPPVDPSNGPPPSPPPVPPTPPSPGS